VALVDGVDLEALEPSVTTVKTGENAYVVSAAGELDLHAAPQLAAELEALAADAAEVVVDLTGVTFMDSTALGVVVAAARSLADAGGRLTGICATGAVRRLLGLVGIDRTLRVYDSPERALEHLVGSVVLRKLEQG
jgi:anti-sigma B factor antagonist